MKKIRRVLLLFVIVAYAGMVCACKGNVEEKEGKTSIEELKTTPTDVEATESETTSGDKESEKESQSKEEITITCKIRPLTSDFNYFIIFLVKLLSFYMVLPQHLLFLF
mgnify:CR=1 FL=1